jgi:translocation and assembly module TamB
MTGVRTRLGTFTKSIFLCVLLVALLISVLLWYTTTKSFEQWVRGRLVTAIERATGGRAELGRFKVVPLRFEVDIVDLTIHGRERAQDVPLVHVDRLGAIVNLPSILGASIGFHSLTLEHPVVHLIFYADGTTNRPTPQMPASTNFEHLFSISIDKLFVKRGELLWQDRRIPLDLALNDLAAALDYSFLHQLYSGRYVELAQGQSIDLSSGLA